MRRRCSASGARGGGRGTESKRGRRVGRARWLAEHRALGSTGLAAAAVLNARLTRWARPSTRHRRLCCRRGMQPGVVRGFTSSAGGAAFDALFASITKELVRHTRRGGRWRYTCGGGTASSCAAATRCRHAAFEATYHPSSRRHACLARLPPLSAVLVLRGRSQPAVGVVRLRQTKAFQGWVCSTAQQGSAPDSSRLSGNRSR